MDSGVAERRQSRPHAVQSTGRRPHCLAANIADVSTASASAVEGVNATRQASTEVARTAEELRGLVGAFKI